MKMKTTKINNEVLIPPEEDERGKGDIIPRPSESQPGGKQILED